MLELRALKGPTGRLLGEMLKERDLLKKPVKGVVNYGYGGDSELPTLNAKAGCQDKYQELVKISQCEVPTVPFSSIGADLQAPIFGRKFHHTRGTDIFVYGVRPLLKADRKSDYYTQVVAKAKEYRVWSFRGRHLAAYEKVLEYPERLGRRGRNKEVWNWANGYAYKFVHPEATSIGLKNIGMDAVAALGLDFGATDVILGTNGRLYVLEVNTAPGTQGEARQGVTSLVNCIERWAKNGFKPRKEE